MTKRESKILKTNAVLIDKGNCHYSKNYLFFKTCDLNDCIMIEPTNYKNRFGHLLDGMQIIYHKKQGLFEVSEFQAGVDENCLYIYTETKSFKKAIKSLLKGNYNCSSTLRIPKKIWD